METLLRKKLSKLAEIVAHPYTFVIVELISAAWLIYGCITRFPTHWITATELVLAFGTFLIVFIVQFSEESETEAIQRKIDAIIKAFPEVDKSTVGLEKEIKAQ